MSPPDPGSNPIVRPGLPSRRGSVGEGKDFAPDVPTHLEFTAEGGKTYYVKWYIPRPASAFQSTWPRLELASETVGNKEAAKLQLLDLPLPQSQDGISMQPSAELVRGAAQRPTQPQPGAGPVQSAPKACIAVQEMGGHLARHVLLSMTPGVGLVALRDTGKCNGSRFSPA
jgi:hypothetical protein